MFVRPLGEPRGSRRAGLEWVDSSSDRRPAGYSRGLAPQASAGSSCGRGLGRLQGRGRVWPGARDPRLEARPAGGTRGPPRHARPRARRPSPKGAPSPDLRAASLQGPDSRSENGGGAAGPASSGKKTQSPRQLSRLRECAASAWQGRPLPLAWRAASLSLRGSPPPR